jgi:hypothetical protein
MRPGCGPWLMVKDMLEEGDWFRRICKVSSHRVPALMVKKSQVEFLEPQ